MENNFVLVFEIDRIVIEECDFSTDNICSLVRCDFFDVVRFEHKRAEKLVLVCDDFVRITRGINLFASLIFGKVLYGPVMLCCESSDSFEKSLVGLSSSFLIEFLPILDSLYVNVVNNTSFDFTEVKNG